MLFEPGRLVAGIPTTVDMRWLRRRPGRSQRKSLRTGGRGGPSNSATGIPTGPPFGTAVFSNPSAQPDRLVSCHSRPCHPFGNHSYQVRAADTEAVVGAATT